ncbi:hypothetical protein [Agrococcus sp. SGAir0287]|uniref:hypothetical protein n=1 Tax=Agrococcus sp. SGAir0287 TaxID=2070347 RepID=UPI0010F50447|nr:hypothetical protein [Agrococcus sp. SGAir0287]
MTVETEQTAPTRPRLPTRRLVTTGIVAAGLYWMVARGSVGGGAGGVTGDGSWIDAQGEPTSEAPLTFAVTLLPSPLVVLVIAGLLVVAWATRDARDRLAWLAPACEVAAIVVPLLAIAGLHAWIVGVAQTWDAGVPISPPWWASSTITIDRMR